LIPTKGGEETFENGGNPLTAYENSRLNFEHRQDEDWCCSRKAAYTGQFTACPQKLWKDRRCNNFNQHTVSSLD